MRRYRRGSLTTLLVCVFAAKSIAAAELPGHISACPSRHRAGRGTARRRAIYRSESPRTRVMAGATFATVLAAAVLYLNPIPPITVTKTRRHWRWRKDR